MQTGIDVMCQNVPVYVCVGRQQCMSAMHPVHSRCAVSVRGELTLMGANWMETASVQSEASSLWLKSFWSSLLLSLSLLLLPCLSMSLPSLFQCPKADERPPLWHMTDTPFCLLSFFHFTDPLHRTTTSPPLPTHPHACMLTPTHFFSVSCILSLSPDKTGHGGTPGARMCLKSIIEKI